MTVRATTIAALAWLLGAVIGCGGSGSKAGADVLSCGESIDQLRAASPTAGPYNPDYTADFAAASANCNGELHEVFLTCDGPFDVMTWSNFPACGEWLYYDHVSGQLTAVVRLANTGGDQCGNAACVAGPSQVTWPPVTTTCSTVSDCSRGP